MVSLPEYNALKYTFFPLRCYLFNVYVKCTCLFCLLKKIISECFEKKNVFLAAMNTDKEKKIRICFILLVREGFYLYQTNLTLILA